MRLRLILMVLSLLSFLSVSVSGYLYYLSSKEIALKEAEKQAVTRLDMIMKNISAFLSENIRPVRTLSGMEEIRRVLENPTDDTLSLANEVVDHFKATLDVEVCYVMNRKGITLASSNRNDPDSFVGENFNFRPYFKQALNGAPSTYMAIGTTSGRRGVYCSHPVYTGISQRPVGVAVIKASIERIEKSIILDDNEIVLVTHPDGIIFVSTKKDWLYGTIRPLSEQEAQRIIKSKQFGTGPLPYIGLEMNEENRAVDKNGKPYLMFRIPVDNYRDWQVIYLQDYTTMEKRIFSPSADTTGMIMLVLCTLIGGSVAVLYKKAGREIVRRKTAEEALRESEKYLSEYSRTLERQVKKRTEEITSILKYTPDMVYIKDINGRYLMINSGYEALLGVKNHEIRGKTADEFMAPELAEQFQSSDRIVLSEKRACRVENQISRKDGIHTYLSVKFPIYDESGNITGVGGISTDITALKKAQHQLKRLSAGIMDGQEKERAAIARELHDELGQLLTALRMDAGWIRNRVRDTDGKIAERAEQMCSLIDKTIDDVRSIAIRLRPGVLDDLGLTDALEWYTSDFERRTEITCIFKPVNVPSVTNTVATAAYRIVQEAMTNVARHADAGCIRVTLEGKDGALLLTVDDDGKGFDVAPLSDSEGLGVAGMQERASLVGGELSVRSVIGVGTQVLARLPAAVQEDE